MRNKLGQFKKGIIPWNKNLTKDDDGRIKQGYGKWNETNMYYTKILKEKYYSCGSDIPELKQIFSERSIQQKAFRLGLKCRSNGCFEEGAVPNRWDGHKLRTKEEIKAYKKGHYLLHKETTIARTKRNRQTKSGRINHIRSNIKRRRNLGFILFDLFGDAFVDFDNDYHHCNDAVVVSIPKMIHKNTLGVNHRERVADYFSSLGIDTFQKLLYSNK